MITYSCENILKRGGAGAGSLLDKEAQMATILTKINVWKSSFQTDYW